MSAGKKVVKGHTAVSADEAGRLLKKAARMKFVPVDPDVEKEIKKRAKKAMVMMEQYISVRCLT
jgi:hypothetical protein